MADILRHAKFLTRREMRAAGLLASLFILNSIGTASGIYEYMPRIDIPLHALGGFLVAYFMLDVVRDALIAERVWWHDMLIVVSASLFVGVVWELCEFLTSQTIGALTAERLGIPYIGSVGDTLKDLANDSAGALVFFLSYRALHRRDKMFR